MGVERLHTHLNQLRLSEHETNSPAQRKQLRRGSSDTDSETPDSGPPSPRDPLDPHPRKTGVVSMVHPTPSGSNVKLKVRLSVHDSYAVVSPDKEVTRDMGYVNLRRSSVERIKNTNAFQIVPQDCDANALTFYVSQEKDLLDWMDSLNCSETPSPLLRRPYSPSRGPCRRPTRRWSAPVGTFMPAIEED